MNDRKRVTEIAQDLKLSLEALSSVGKPKRQGKPIQQLLDEWRGQAIPVSAELRNQFYPKPPEGVSHEC